MESSIVTLAQALAATPRHTRKHKRNTKNFLTIQRPPIECHNLRHPPQNLERPEARHMAHIIAHEVGRKVADLFLAEGSRRLARSEKFRGFCSCKCS